VLRVRKLAVIASAVLALGSVSLAFPGSASASTTGPLCNLNLGGTTLCASGGSSGYVSMSDSGGSTWIYHPNVSTTTIRLQGTNDCMTVDANNNRITMTGCIGGVDQLFEPSAGEIFTTDLDYDGCLNDHYQVSQLNVATCNEGTDQLWSS
jgi:hypothetical protein